MTFATRKTKTGHTLTHMFGRRAGTFLIDVTPYLDQHEMTAVQNALKNAGAIINVVSCFNIELEGGSDTQQYMKTIADALESLTTRGAQA